MIQLFWGFQGPWGNRVVMRVCSGLLRYSVILCYCLNLNVLWLGVEGVYALLLGHRTSYKAWRPPEMYHEPCHQVFHVAKGPRNMVHSFLVLRTHSLIQRQPLPLFFLWVFSHPCPSGGGCHNVLKESIFCSSKQWTWSKGTKSSG